MSSRILIAGVGNVFFGDDGFGVELARQLSAERLPPQVRVIDFGIRGLHLAFELLDPPPLLIALDAVSRGGAPGTLYVLEPEPDLPAVQGDAHGMHLGAVFASVRAMGGVLPPVRIIGCEVADVSERLGLSEPVARAVPGAIALVRELVARTLSGAQVQEVVP